MCIVLSTGFVLPVKANNEHCKQNNNINVSIFDIKKF